MMGDQSRSARVRKFLHASHIPPFVQGRTEATQALASGCRCRRHDLHLTLTAMHQSITTPTAPQMRRRSAGSSSHSVSCGDFKSFLNRNATRSASEFPRAIEIRPADRLSNIGAANEESRLLRPSMARRPVFSICFGLNRRKPIDRAAASRDKTPTFARQSVRSGREGAIPPMARSKS